MAYIMIFGASSDIAKAVAEAYAEKGYDIYLVVRHTAKEERLAQHLNVCYGIKTVLIEVDACQSEKFTRIYNDLPEKPMGFVCAVGYLGDEEQAHVDPLEAKRIIDANFACLVAPLHVVAADFEQRKSGFIVGISSVAGDRGRKSNYVYGAAKAGFSAFLSGLRNRLFDAGVHVMTVKPGFVATKMTAGMTLPSRLTATPAEVAQAIVAAQQKRKDVVYVYGIWRWIMWIIRLLPETIFKRTSI